MVEVDPSWNGVEVLVYLLKNDPALWFIIGFGLIIFFILGAFAGFLNIYRVMRRIEKQ